MKKITTILLFLVCLMSASMAVQAQCDSYDSIYPPPYPPDYPCMESFFDDPANEFCCEIEFDQFCLTQMRLHCDTNGFLEGDCYVERCGRVGNTQSPPYDCVPENFGLAFPFCGLSPCPSYDGDFPPPGPNPPIVYDLGVEEYVDILDGRLLEVFRDPNGLAGGFCCGGGISTPAWDFCCQSVLDSINVLVCEDNDPATVNGCHGKLGCTYTPIPSTLAVLVKLKIFLEGAYIGNELMTTKLRDENILPINQPFNRPPWNYAGTEGNGLTNNDLPANAVDWVLVELRNPLDTEEIMGAAAGILLEDGRVIDAPGGRTDGLVVFGAMPNTNYYIVVKSRNHLSVMSALPAWLSSHETINLSFGSQDVGSFNIVGYDQMTQLEFFDPDPNALGDDFALFGMYVGDINSDEAINAADFDGYADDASGILEYLDGDVNYDGRVTYADFNAYQANVGRTSLTAIIFDDTSSCYE
ncbi:MAG: hypothetical protein ACPG5B_08715 [Chitinophagales bacterium]